jgi:hypothetical protein
VRRRAQGRCCPAPLWWPGRCLATHERSAHGGGRRAGRAPEPSIGDRSPEDEALSYLPVACYPQAAVTWNIREAPGSCLLTTAACEDVARQEECSRSCSTPRRGHPGVRSTERHLGPSGPRLEQSSRTAPVHAGAHRRVGFSMPNSPQTALQSALRPPRGDPRDSLDHSRNAGVKGFESLSQFGPRILAGGIPSSGRRCAPAEREQSLLLDHTRSSLPLRVVFRRYRALVRGIGRVRRATPVRRAVKILRATS